jgi:phage N-6-adenine-methyltransferase
VTALATLTHGRLADLEGVIERGLTTFIEVGQALTEIRDQRLYRDSHKTFEGYCQERWGWSRVRAHQVIQGAQVAGMLTVVNTPPPQSERVARELAPLVDAPEAMAEVWNEALTEHGPTPTAAEVRSLVESGRPPHRTRGTGQHEWYTPAKYIELARGVLGQIDLDPASSDLAQATVKATSYFTAADNGLTQEWHGRVWLNPPYSQPEIAQFIEKLVDEYRAGRVSAAILLTNNSTETAWFQSAAYQCAALAFPAERIRFLSPAGEMGAPLQGQSFFYFGPDAGRFASLFASEGRVFLDEQQIRARRAA